jgi:hypothetical protein
MAAKLKLVYWGARGIMVSARAASRGRSGAIARRSLAT